MSKFYFDEAIKTLGKYDPHIADCIKASVEGIEDGLNRSMSEEEKMVAYTMFLSGVIAESFRAAEERDRYTTACLN